MKLNKKGKPFLIIGGAILILGAASIVPWSKLTNGFFKDYNLIGDLTGDTGAQPTGDEIIDPELANAVPDSQNKTAALKDTLNANPYEVANPKPRVPNKVDGAIIIEDYTVDNRGLRNLKNALSKSNSANKCARIAVIGDSYIEGDIMTMNLRETLQDTYGGSGVGYMPASSELTGFRQTVRQYCKGWTQHEIRKDMRESMRILSGEYFTAGNNASTQYDGVSKLNHLDSWNKTTVLANAPKGGTVTLTVNDTPSTYKLAASDSIKAIVVPGNTSSVKLSATNGVEIAGVYLDDVTGIAVDNMSLRGNSGLTHRNLSIDRAAQMRPFINYDLIIVEYGINALTSKQKDYTHYKNLMKETVTCLRKCYPNADILVLGIGDRGQKSGSQVKSLPTSEFMVEAQRDVARETGVLFWDTREAMGGEDAVVRWREQGLINPDYIHLNQKGGKALADLLANAIIKALKK